MAVSFWQPYDERMPWGSDDQIGVFVDELAGTGARLAIFPADLANPVEVERLTGDVTDALGPITALILNHAESVDSAIDDTTIDSFDKHFAINARASWLLIRHLPANSPDREAPEELSP